MATPAKAWSMTLRETPAAVASRPMADRKVLKSPPHCAAWAGAASRTLKRTRANSLVMDGPVLPPGDLYTVIAGLVPSAVLAGLVPPAVLARPEVAAFVHPHAKAKMLIESVTTGATNAQGLLGHHLSRD